MFLQQTKSLCHFYKSTSGLALGGGCTKAFLDSVHGDVSRVCTADGGPIFQGLCSGMNAVDAGGKPVLRVGGVMATILPGLVAVVNSTRHEVLASGEDTVELSSEAWLNEMMIYAVNTTGASSIVTINNPDLYFQGQAVIARYYGGSYLGNFTVVNVDAVNYQITVDDNNALYSAYNEGDIALAPAEWTGVQVIIGGAYNDFQTTLNNLDAYYRDQWLFFSEDLAPAVKYEIIDGHDGENNNNTRLYIVGYNTHAYDCLPPDPNYFPAATQNVGTHYKTALQRAKDRSDASIAGDLPVVSSANLPDWAAVFNLRTNVENVVLMGLFFQLDLNKKAVGVGVDTTGSSFIRHCAVGASGYDASPKLFGGQALFNLGGIGVGGAVYDCFAKGVMLLNAGGSTSTAAGGAWEVSYCIGIHCGNLTAKNFGMTAHHNILMHGGWGLALSTRGSIVAYNNIIFKPTLGGMVFDGYDSRVSAYNNIFIIDEDLAVYGVIGVLNGSAVYWDYNCYCKPDGTPVDLFISGPGGSADNVNYNYIQKGMHDVEANPLFTDPDGFNFQLKSGSPCIGAGRPDIVGNPTSIGLSVSQTTVPVGIFGKRIGLYGA
jgi:hypothetical protein